MRAQPSNYRHPEQGEVLYEREISLSLVLLAVVLVTAVTLLVLSR